MSNDLVVAFRPLTNCSGLRCEDSGADGKGPLVLVTPRTVVDWHRAGFRLYWKWLSRSKHLGGRKPTSKEIRGLIFRIAAENPSWERRAYYSSFGLRCVRSYLHPVERFYFTHQRT